ncbi:MAG: hypothetical protein ACLFUF_06195, partial [Opitutales bacterium]
RFSAGSRLPRKPEDGVTQTSQWQGVRRMIDVGQTHDVAPILSFKDMPPEVAQGRQNSLMNLFWFTSKVPWQLMMPPSASVSQRNKLTQ